MKKPPVIHYAGALHWRRKGWVTKVGGGWAACCSGDRAFKIRERGNHTYERSHVTCKLCRQRLRWHDETVQLEKAEEAERLRWN